MLAAEIPLVVEEGALLVVGAGPDLVRIGLLVAQQGGVVFAGTGRLQVLLGNGGEIELDGGHQLTHLFRHRHHLVGHQQLQLRQVLLLSPLFPHLEALGRMASLRHLLGDHPQGIAKAGLIALQPLPARLPGFLQVHAPGMHRQRRRNLALQPPGLAQALLRATGDEIPLQCLQLPGPARLPQGFGQGQHLPVQARQLAGDEPFQPQHFQHLEPAPPAASADAGGIDVEGAVAGLGPEVGGHRLGQLEVGFGVVEPGHQLRQVEHLTIGPATFVLFQLQSAAAEPLDEGLEHRRHFVEERGRRTQMAGLQVAFQVPDHLHGGAQPLAVVAVHGLQRPGRDHLRLHPL